MTKQPFYWTAPEFIRTIIQKVYKPKDEYMITAVRDDKDQWVFSYSFFRNEPFVMGAAKTMDAWYYDIHGVWPKCGDVITITATINKPATYYSRMDYSYHNESNWSVYTDSASGNTADFCPVFKVMWGGFPNTVYVHTHSITVPSRVAVN